MITLEEVLAAIISLLIIIIGALGIGCIVLYEKNSALKISTQAYKQQIEQMHTDAVQTKIFYASQAVDANKKMDAINSRSYQISVEKVSPDCEQSMQWLIKEAQTI